MATSVSGTNLATDDELDDDERSSTRKTSSLTASDYQDRRGSDCSSITNFTINKTSSDFQLNTKTSRASSRASGTNLPPLITHTTGPNSKRLPGKPPLPPSANEIKEKHGVRKLIQKIFKSSSSNPPKTPTNPRSPVLDSSKSPVLNIDNARGTAYPSLRPLTTTQGPIRLLVLRHGERLDRYYSSQWLRQAFDKDGNYCRFSPILP